MADSRITLSFDEQDRALLKSLTEEIKSLRAQLAGSALPCPRGTPRAATDHNWLWLWP